MPYDQAPRTNLNRIDSVDVDSMSYEELLERFVAPML